MSKFAVIKIPTYIQVPFDSVDIDNLIDMIIDISYGLKYKQNKIPFRDAVRLEVNKELEFRL